MLDVNLVVKFLRTFLCLAFVSLCASCANVTPTTGDRSTVPFDGNDRNGGIIRYLPDGALEVTPAKLEQYNQLISDYGDNIVPKTAKNFGATKLPNGNYALTKQGAERFYALILEAERQRRNKAQ